MRKLAFVLCAALVGLSVSVVRTQPVLASGIADVPPTVIAPAPGQLVIYEKSTASTTHVYQKTWNGSWSGWNVVSQYGDAPLSIAGNLSALSPSATAAFAVLVDQHMWCGSTGLPWASDPLTNLWTSFRAATPGVLDLRNNTARLVAISPTDHVLTAVWPIGFNPQGCDIPGGFNWLDSGGGSPWNPAIAGTGSSDYLMAVTGTDGNEWWSYNSSPWTRTVAGGGPSGPALTTWGSGRYDIFVRGSDNALWHTSDPNAPNWESLGGGLKSGPGCASWAPNRIDCFVIGNDFAVWHILWDGGAWSAWESIGTA